MIKLQDVEKSYGSHKVLKRVNLKVEEGEIYGLLGPNGAGKTTLFQTMLGLLNQDSGSIEINGRPNQSTKQVKRDIGYLPSDISFYEDLSAKDNLRFFADLADKEPDFDHLLELVGLEDDKHRAVGDFSTGMKKRLGIAQSLIKDPEIAIYDEPTTGLDPKGKNEFRKQVEKINEEKDVTVIISSHITGEISPLCDRFGILSGGEIAASGTKEELGRKTGSEAGLSFKAGNPQNAEEVLQSYEGLEYRRSGKNFEVTGEEKDDLLEDLFEADSDIKEFTSDRSSLESTYLALTEGGSV